MTLEQYGNRCIKGLWRLTGLKSSELVKLLVNESLMTGSRARGLLSAPGNKNYRPATENDVDAVVQICRKIGLKIPESSTLNLRQFSEWVETENAKKSK